MGRLTRRALLACGLIGLPALAAGGGFAAAFAGARTGTLGRVAFTRPLAVPPLAESRLDGAGRRVFDLVAEAGETDFLPGGPTVTWGVNGGYLGPTLRAARGERVLINVRNDLGEPTSLHWHGMHLPAAMDGGPHQEIPPGRSWAPAWTVDQRAATLWYHPHPHGRTARHVYRGLAGLFIVDDPGSEPEGLPHRYGVDDIPVIVQDKNFDRNNQLDEDSPALSDVGVLGETIVVNGTVAPYLRVTTERVRLRLLNASNARVYRFGFADDRPFRLIATDGGLLPAPHETTRIQLSPGERAEIVVEAVPGERAVLRSYPPRIGTNFWDERFSGGDDAFDVLELRGGSDLEPAGVLPAVLAPAPAVDLAEPAAERAFQLTGREINGKLMDMGRIDFASAVDTTEVWEVVNIDGTYHNFHVHDVQFQVLSVDGQKPPPELSGWKDTVFLPPYRKVRIALHFTDHTDPDTPYMYHCHVLYHEDQGMMGQFTVVEPGQEPGPAEMPAHGA
ncbi:multicopper oxidase domain-containing protein [Streptomonospora sp. PA3]|uniref:multicopper oxidase family protein n=1 Tax=Streptomonospora sp. PA3 TaxID=2607326 RepID=UPI0012DE14B3|nr:multicopper oxidase domain-containing protein [Streptomonospora sp. PA3]MUL44284.1 multicopper oxidase domain-containing protein [Streptomonospora sp. PA3]